MNKFAIAIFAFVLATTGHARAGEPGCDTVPLNVLSLACHLSAIELVAIRLDGSATTLGLKRKRLENDVKRRLKVVLPAAVRITPIRDATTSAVPLTLNQRGRFSCTVWTVGLNFPIALFVECSLESLDGEQTIDARLLGHTRQAELHDTVRIALQKVVDKISIKLRDQRKNLRTPVTPFNVGTFN